MKAWRILDTHFHMSPSALKTPVPNTDRMHRWKNSPFSKLSKSVASIACKDMSACREIDGCPEYLDMLRLCCDNLVYIQCQDPETNF